VIGRAVGDVIHLLAELLENAASFSPPQTRVEVAGQVLPNGYAIEIEDRGLGMSAEAVEAANRKLLEPPDFDPTDSARLGLFVVAQLANRHGIRVSLRPSAFGGITAIVLVPAELVTGAPGPMELPAGPSKAEKTDDLWDRPLVGSGNDDPTRRSLAALQWQGTEQLRSITVPRAHPGDETIHIPPVAPTGPQPSSVAEGLSADGLVQRRRTRPPAVPTSPAPAGAGEKAESERTTRELPRRVRQASIAPQLRHASPEPEADTQPLRSPEQIRALMSALQRGTTRGRLAAAGVDPEAPIPAPRTPPDDASFSEAATVSFPVVPGPGEGGTNGTGNHPGANHEDQAG
jgi:hypothetical protein